MSGAFIPGDVVTLAAVGDLESLRLLAEHSYWGIGTADPALVPAFYSEAISFARLASAIGERIDRVNLMFLLSDFAGWWDRNGRPDLAIGYEGQALAFAEAMAEDGDQEVGNMVVLAGDRLPVEVFDAARYVRDTARSCQH